ncbi:MAG: threonylcarbamoyl-AMP synthase [Bacteroidales bacterium]|nr:threonylcarbamoyl-AMP synthase [Bacteroidales bacterium]MCF8388315.1 threonylcarbamoyl-AMP synthase [Bacteroidales bacterium]MCF8396828.1 threonylcarbamoyl-AMP synthase [Bacteroidales bacterium]
MEEEVKKTVEYLRNGKVILYPTDTIWGIGCDATNPRIVQKVYKIKRRQESKSMIILLDETAKLNQYVKDVPDIALDLINSIETPLTVIFSNAKNLARNVLAADKTVAIRISRDEFCRKIIREFGKPIVSTSANISGDPNPILFNQISEKIKNEVDYIVNLHRTRINETKPSTIIKLKPNGSYDVIRQ